LKNSWLLENKASSFLQLNSARLDRREWWKDRAPRIPVNAPSAAPTSRAIRSGVEVRAAVLALARLIFHSLGARWASLHWSPMPEHGTGDYQDYANKRHAAGPRLNHGAYNTADHANHNAEAKKKLGKGLC
jgi:hypothetical protein